MTTTHIQTPLVDAVATQFAAFENKLNGKKQQPLHTLRQEALQTFRQFGFPTTKHEEWKYTNLKRIVEKVYEQPTATTTNIANHLLPLEGLQSNVLVFVNGQYQAALSKITPQAQLTILPLAEALQTHSELINKHLGKYATNSKDAFVAMNTAFVEQGVFIHVAAKTVIETPIYIQHLTDTTNQNVLVQPRLLVLAEKFSEFTIVEKFRGFGQKSALNNVVREMVVEDNAHVNHYILQNELPTVSHINHTVVQQASNSLYNNVTVSLNGEIIRNSLDIVIAGQNCESHLLGLYAPTGNTHIDNHTLVDHQQPNSYSNEMYKGLMDGKSVAVFNGKIYVRPHAQKTNAFQSNKNILLSETASVNTKPQLEIWADDVKCSHGCTTGALDEEPMFYLRSRGVPEKQARALLMFAFVEDILDKIQVPALREHIENLMAERLQITS
ncbi:MAG: Fe-S cluster assembly protein SufD [Thermoflexibacteraceae bacterium]